MPAKQETPSSTPRIQSQLRFAPPSSVNPDAGFATPTPPVNPDAGFATSTPDLRSGCPDVVPMDASAAPNQPDHRADTDESASANYSHDAGHMGVGTDGPAEQLDAQ